MNCDCRGKESEFLAGDSKACFAIKGVIDYDFFANFMVVIERLVGTMTYVKN